MEAIYMATGKKAHSGTKRIRADGTVYVQKSIELDTATLDIIQKVMDAQGLNFNQAIAYIVAQHTPPTPRRKRGG